MNTTAKEFVNYYLNSSASFQLQLSGEIHPKNPGPQNCKDAKRECHCALLNARSIHVVNKVLDLKTLTVTDKI